MINFKKRRAFRDSLPEPITMFGIGCTVVFVITLIAVAVTHVSTTKTEQAYISTLSKAEEAEAAQSAEAPQGATYAPGVAVETVIDNHITILQVVEDAPHGKLCYIYTTHGSNQPAMSCVAK